MDEFVVGSALIRCCICPIIRLDDILDIFVILRTSICGYETTKNRLIILKQLNPVSNLFFPHSFAYATLMCLLLSEVLSTSRRASSARYFNSKPVSFRMITSLFPNIISGSGMPVSFCSLYQIEVIRLAKDSISNWNKHLNVTDQCLERCKSTPFWT